MILLSLTWLLQTPLSIINSKMFQSLQYFDRDSVLCPGSCHIMSFLNRRIPLSRYSNRYLISPLILAQACPSNIAK